MIEFNHLFFITVLFSTTVFATSEVSLKQYREPTHQFKLEYPVSWNAQPPEKQGISPIVVTLSKGDHTVMVSVMLAKQESKLKAVEFQNQMDKSRKATNLIPENQRALKADAIQKAKADEAAIGSYEIAGTTPVLQKSLTLKKGKKIFVLTGTFQKARQTEDEKIVDSVLASFQFLN